jgi:septal ring factor EnvC (AmiA/AmiB activator)
METAKKIGIGAVMGSVVVGALTFDLSASTYTQVDSKRVLATQEITIDLEQVTSEIANLKALREPLQRELNALNAQIAERETLLSNIYKDVPALKPTK